MNGRQNDIKLTYVITIRGYRIVSSVLTYGKQQMCEQRVALDMILGQPKRGGLSKSAIILHEKQCEDFIKLEHRMTDLEKKVDAVERKVETLDGKIDRVLELCARKTSIWGAFKEVLSNKVFIYILITLLCAAFGVSVGEVGTFLFK